MKIMKKERQRPRTRGNTISAYLDARTYGAIMARATKTGEKVNAIVSAAVREYLGIAKAR
jgi:hypothetical protein